MCQIYHEVGSLTTVKKELKRNNIRTFSSLKDVMNFQASYQHLRETITTNHKNLIQSEMEKLEVQMEQTKQAISIQTDMTSSTLLSRKEDLTSSIRHLQKDSKSGIIPGIISDIKRWHGLLKLQRLNRNFDRLVAHSVKNLQNLYDHDSSRYEYLIKHTEEAIEISASSSFKELDHIKATVDQLKPFILGALGEHQVVKELRALSDDYYLINNLSLHFKQGIYGGQSLGYIRSVQMDHVLVGPPGVFLIETKNWSPSSLADRDLFSPVLQIKRAGYSLFKLLNRTTFHHQTNLATHHWGDRKIPVKNILVFIKTKPMEKFKHVSVLTLPELLGYINYFEPALSNTEVQKITDRLLNFMDWNG